MTDKELYDYMWKEYNRSGDLEYIKDYIKRVIKDIDNSGTLSYYRQVTISRPYLQIILEGLEQL
jgi:hypothetical protein